MKHTINRGDVFYANLKSDGTSRQYRYGSVSWIITKQIV